LKIINEGSYSKTNVQELRDVLRDFAVKQSITFPVRAGLLSKSESQENILSLLDQFPKSTLTIWSGIYDIVDVPGLMKLIEGVGKERIFIDVPNGLSCQIEHFNSEDYN